MKCPTCNGTGEVPDTPSVPVDGNLRYQARKERPAAGELFIDPTFGSRITRITSAVAPSWFAPEYPTIDCFNSDQSRLLLQNVDHFTLHDGDGRFIRDLSIPASAQPKWSRTLPQFLVYISGNDLIAYDTEKKEVFSLARFEEYESISGNGESDISDDGEHFVLVGDDTDVFVFKHRTKTKTIISRSANRAIDSVMLTPNNNVVIAWRVGGIEVHAAGGIFGQLTRANGHKDICQLDGESFMLWCSSDDPNWTANAVTRVSLADGKQTQLLKLDPQLIAFHISCSDVGWALISTYQKPGTPWVAYSNELFLIHVRTGEIRRIAHHRSVVSDYTAQPKAVLSRDAKKIVYASNWGSTVVDTYLINL